MKYSVYILECSDGSFYTGITNDLERRLNEHKSGENMKAYTARRLPVKLVFYTQFHQPLEAIDFEKKLKKWSHAKKSALINGEWDQLPNLAKKKFR